MEKGIRISLILTFTLLFGIIIQYIAGKISYSFLIICPLILLYYFLIIRIKKIIKKAVIFFETIQDKIIGIDITRNATLEEIGILSNQGYLYEPTKMRHIYPLFKENGLLFDFNEKIIDLGSGKGGALIALKKSGFNFVSGVEISENLCKIAKHNLQKLKIEEVQIFNSDVLIFNQFESFDTFYMFNPFPDNIISEVILKIEKSIEIKPRVVKIIYMNPKHQNVIDNSRVFKKIGEYNYDSEKSAYRNIIVYKNK